MTSASPPGGSTDRDGVASARSHVASRQHHTRARRATEAQRHREIHDSVSGLHAFTDMFDQVRSERVGGLWLLVALNVADVVTTAWFLTIGGTEANPVLAPIIQRSWLLILIKFLVLTVVSWRVLSAPTRSRGTQAFVVVACLYYAAVVSWNLTIIDGL